MTKMAVPDSFLVIFTIACHSSCISKYWNQSTAKKEKKKSNLAHFAPSAVLAGSWAGRAAGTYAGRHAGIAGRITSGSAGITGSWAGR